MSNEVEVYGWVLYNEMFGAETSDIWFTRQTTTSTIRIVFDKDSREPIRIDVLKQEGESNDNETRESTQSKD